MRLSVLVVAFVAALPAAAASPVQLRFDPLVATPHTLVVAKTTGTGALRRARKRTLKVYLESQPRAKLGRLAVNRKGNGRLIFNTPNVPAGPYRVLLRGLSSRPTFRVVGSFRVIDGPATRSCQQSVYGQLGGDWLQRSYNVGPIHFVGYDPVEASDPSWLWKPYPDSGQYAVKQLLVIDRGPALTIAVASQDRMDVALSYIPGRFNRHRVTDLDPAVTFQPCTGSEQTPPWAKNPYTQFNGGFVFRHPLCAHLTIAVEGRDAVPLALPLGHPC
jgi:hypothetical protein